MPSTPYLIIDEKIDPDLERIMFHLLEKELVHRTHTADELLAELESWPLHISWKQLTSPSDHRTSTKSQLLTWEQNNNQITKKSWIFFWIFLFLATVPDAIIGSAIIIGGAILFYFGQERHRPVYTVGGLGLMLTGILATLITWVFIGFFTSLLWQWDPTVFDTYSQIQLFITLPFYIIALHFLVKIRHLTRERFLLKTIRENSHDPRALIDTLGNFVDIHLGDTNVHQKYVELLLSFGYIKEAIVESKRILDIDPYNFGATFLLARGYYEIGLYEECIQVCYSYLAVSGYSFEFSDLRDLCIKQMEQ